MAQTSNIQSNMTFAEIEAIINTYLEERDWLNGNARNLAISVQLEASELVEHYQWSETPIGTKEEIAAELADVLLYSFQFAYVNGIDMTQAILDKLEKTKKKYPAEAFKGKNSQDRRQAWIEAKKNHKKEEIL
jgi:NTP pyrophosphatase (non-canonical NTP hydrolase)